MLRPLIESSELHINPSYHRAMLVCCALGRRGGGFDSGQGLEDWRAYNPEKQEVRVHSIQHVDQYIYIDLLRSIRDANPGIGAEEDSLDHIIGLLILHNTSHSASLEFSQASLKVGPKEICDFIVRPMNPNHFNTLSWERASAGAVILDALSADPTAAGLILCPETINYLGLCLRVSYDELHAAKPKTSYLSSLLLNGVAAATEATSRLCNISRGNIISSKLIVSGMRNANAIVASKFFISFLGESQSHLSRHMFDLQDRAAFSSILFLDELAALLGLGAGRGSSAEDIESELNELALTVGETLCAVVKNLREAFGGATIRTAQVLDALCRNLTKLCTTVIGVDEAIRVWKIFPALRAHFPATLDGVNEFGTENDEFRSGLGMLPPSYYDLLKNLCAVEAGRNSVLLDGFLRRALDTLRVIFSSLESEKDHEDNAYRRKCGMKLNPDKDERKLYAACVFLVSKMANFNHPIAGSANDLILMEIFDLVPMLSKILSSKSCYRKDEVFISAIELTSVLALDAVRTNLVFRINDMTSKIDNELHRVSEHSLQGAKAAVKYVLNIALGVRRADMRMNELMPHMREGLVRASRYHPQLSQLVADALYASTKYAGVQSKDVDSLIKDLATRITDRDEDDLSSTASGVVRKSAMSGTLRATDLSSEDKELCSMLPSEDILNELVFLSAQQERKQQLSRQMSNWLEKTEGPNGEYIDRTDFLALPGTYDVCGVSSCGTLHNTDSPYFHGGDDKMPYSFVSLHGNTNNKAKSISEERRSKSYSELKVEKKNDTVQKLELTKIPAKEKELQDMVLQRKQHYGFAPKLGDSAEELPCLTMKPCKAEDFGLGARPENRYIFDKATDPESRRKRSEMRNSPLKTLKNPGPLSPLSPGFSPSSEKRDVFSPIDSTKAKRKAKGNTTTGKPIDNNYIANKHTVSKKPAGFEVIAVDDLPELMLTKPPPPGKRGVHR